VKKYIRLIITLLVMLPCITTFAQDSPEFLAALIKNFDQKTTVPLSFKQDMAEALSVQEQFLAHLSRTMGKPVGYKAALTNPGAQTKFGVDTPVYGVLLEKMLVPSGSKLPVHFGTLPLMEGDLIVRVGSEDINEATSPESLLAGLDAIIPFLELPDLVFKKGTSLSGPALVAVNAGARLGVLGNVIPLTADASTMAALGKIRLEMTDSTGTVVGHGYANALMTHPIKVVEALRDHLLSQGSKLKKGDLISLGSITAMVPVRKPDTIKLTYFGIPGVETAEVTVEFVP